MINVYMDGQVLIVILVCLGNDLVFVIAIVKLLSWQQLPGTVSKATQNVCATNISLDRSVISVSMHQWVLIDFVIYIMCCHHLTIVMGTVTSNSLKGNGEGM